MDGRDDSGRLRVFSENPASYFERGFTEIAQTRMKGLPILNPKLRVYAAEFRRWQNDWIGTLVLPSMPAAIAPAGKTKAREPSASLNCRAATLFLSASMIRSWASITCSL